MGMESGWRLRVMILVGAAIMKWRFRSVKEKTRQSWKGSFEKKQMEF
jgi:hypothetical protein